MPLGAFATSADPWCRLHAACWKRLTPCTVTQNSTSFLCVCVRLALGPHLAVGAIQLRLQCCQPHLAGFQGSVLAGQLALKGLQAAC
jgi:hypothetical protein